jgi:hypothetical protein
LDIYVLGNNAPPRPAGKRAVNARRARPGILDFALVLPNALQPAVFLSAFGQWPSNVALSENGNRPSFDSIRANSARFRRNR